MHCELSDKIFNVSSSTFESLALEIFHFQYANNRIYRQFVDALHIHPDQVTSIFETPFLPAGLFKNEKILIGQDFERVFESSRTTGQVPSKHYIKDILLYEQSFKSGFEQHFGDIQNWCVLALLPSYLEQNNSSLVYMTSKLIEWSTHPCSGFCLKDLDGLAKTLNKLEKEGQKTLLLGVSFALLEFAAKHPMTLKHTMVMETGGMKGRRKEIIREELHQQLGTAFGLSSISSEYGMTELLSQAYAEKDGIFTGPPWMKILIREPEDPLAIRCSGNGGINIIDLANIYSCSFLETQDAGELFNDGSFRITGRIDHSELRGCSLMVVA